MSAQTRLFGGPMAEQDRLWPTINVVPGNAAALGLVSTHRANLSEIDGHLAAQGHAWPQPCMNNQMRAQINAERERSKKFEIAFAVWLEFFERRSLTS
jgi:hypothetical protein